MFNNDYIKVLEFLESYEEELFTQQTLIDKGITYYAKISYILNDLFEWGVIREVRVGGMGRVRLYKFNRDSEVYKMIKDLINVIKL